MRPIVTAPSLLGLTVMVQPAAAAPPESAKPLSESIEALEDNAEVAGVTGVGWDDDGYWEVDYVRKDGSKVEVRSSSIPSRGRPSAEPFLPPGRSGGPGKSMESCCIVS